MLPRLYDVAFAALEPFFGPKPQAPDGKKHAAARTFGKIAPLVQQGKTFRELRATRDELLNDMIRSRGPFV
jgi:hypothetical protein